MFDEKRHHFCFEFYTVEKSTEVAMPIRGEETRVRIEALRDERRGTYTTRAYVEEHGTLQPTYPQTGDSYDRPPEDFCVWVTHDLPQTIFDSADAVLKQALDFLMERCSR